MGLYGLIAMFIGGVSILVGVFSFSTTATVIGIVGVAGGFTIIAQSAEVD